jgi:hypothetical protein
MNLAKRSCVIIPEGRGRERGGEGRERGGEGWGRGGGGGGGGRVGCIVVHPKLVFSVFLSFLFCHMYATL